MENIARVTTHLRRRLAAAPGRDPDRETLTVVPTRAAGAYWRGAQGECWRCYLFIEGARSVDVVEHPRQAYEAAKAFGAFQRLLGDLPAPPLHETIPHFHDTPRRVAALERALAADACGRARTCAAEAEFALSLKGEAGRVVQGLAQGALPWRVTHNDSKINNVMLEDGTDRGVCVIDLDTAMPGSVLYDFGDLVRTATGRFAENAGAAESVGVDLAMFEQLVAGYLEGAGGTLSERELELLSFAGVLITYTIGVRFLTDYLEGDVYFKTRRPGENLERCRTQFALVRNLRREEGVLRAIVERQARAAGGGQA